MTKDDLKAMSSKERDRYFKRLSEAYRYQVTDDTDKEQTAKLKNRLSKPDFRKKRG